MTIYNHSYREMKYQCDGCGEAIFVWNGRDGATPKFVRCCATEGCQGFMEHVEWDRDIRTDNPLKAKWEFYGDPEKPELRLRDNQDA